VSTPPRRGQVYWVDFSPTKGSEQAGRRPAVIVSNDMANRASPVVTVVPMTSQPKRPFPWNVPVPADGRLKAGTVLCNQLRTVAKERLDEEPVGALDEDLMSQVDAALKMSLGLK
jgi:mRNA interferase MazF